MFELEQHGVTMRETDSQVGQWMSRNKDVETGRQITDRNSFSEETVVRRKIVKVVPARL
jgi:hypothetical protein